MAASMAGRSTLVRTLCRTSTNLVPRRPSSTIPLGTSNFPTRRIPIFHAPPLRFLRRELSSFKPVHSAIASTHLVSKLPSESTTSSEGRFANYLSPI